MKKKIETWLTKKRKMLPLHGQDSNILIDAIIGGKWAKDCNRYLARLGNIYFGILPLPACGEVNRFIFTELDSHEKRMRFFDTYAQLIDYRKIEIYVPQEESHKIYRELVQIDSRIENIDAFILASAIEARCNVFVTLDDDLIENRIIERRFKIKIKQPSDLL